MSALGKRPRAKPGTQQRTSLEPRECRVCRRLVLNVDSAAGSVLCWRCTAVHVEEPKQKERPRA